eukprot:Selendium_serpulae@DN2862_c0_g1_i1.p1
MSLTIVSSEGPAPCEQIVKAVSVDKEVTFEDGRPLSCSIAEVWEGYSITLDVYRASGSDIGFAFTFTGQTNLHFQISLDVTATRPESNETVARSFSGQCWDCKPKMRFFDKSMRFGFHSRMLHITIQFLVTRTEWTLGSTECATRSPVDLFSQPPPSWLTGAEILGTQIGSLLQTRDGADVLVRVGGQEQQLHSVVLKARSPVFAALLTDPDNRAQKIQLTDFSVATASSFFHFLYTGVYKFHPIFHTLEQLSDLLRMSHTYQVDSLKDVVAVHMKEFLSFDNCLDLLQLAFEFDCAVLREATALFATKNTGTFTRLQRDQRFINLEGGIIRYLLSTFTKRFNGNQTDEPNDEPPNPRLPDGVLSHDRRRIKLRGQKDAVKQENTAAKQR